MDEDFVARMDNAQNRDRVLQEFNRPTLDDVGPVGGEQGLKLRQEMNDLGGAEGQLLQESPQKIHTE